MKYTVILTEDNKGNFYAKVPSIPDCSAKAKTKNEAINLIRNAISKVMSRSEIIQLDLPTMPKSGSLLSETPWELFGAFKDTSDWSKLFDEIEIQRNNSLI
ncbi:type II toxin-antitoxin system HicB family antitoxin [candidate division KSB1 bacterium]|nr:type II toxin-antitoxin system HicB family antitoxin [candidate division KSB1 bacterium]